MTCDLDIAEEELAFEDTTLEESFPCAPLGRTARQLRTLETLCAQAMGQIALLGGTGDELPSERPSPHRTAEAFERYARVVRLTIAMERRLVAEDEDKAKAEADRAEKARVVDAATRTLNTPPSPAKARRDVLRNVVGDMIEAEFGDNPLMEKQRKAAFAESERLIDKDASDDDILNRPILELVALVCEELEIEPDWDLWVPSDWSDPDWGLTPAELSDDARPTAPPDRASAAWPPPGTVMPLPEVRAPP